MAANLPPDLFPKVTQLLQPHMVDTDEREAWLTQAFYLKEPRLYQMDRSGSAMVFTTRCVRTLMEFGCFIEPEREHSLATLLKTIRFGCGPDKQSEIDRLVPVVDEICHEPDSHQSAVVASPSVPRSQPLTVNTPVGDRRPTVFVSYSHSDKTFAERLIGDLQQAGHQVWIDTTALKGGDLWVRAIAEGIINSYAFLVVVSRKALQSQYVQDEITWAKTRNKKILVALLEDVVGDVEFFPLVNIQGVKFFESDYSAAIQSLVAGLPAPSIPSGEAGVQISEPAPISQRALELQYLDRLRFEILLNTEKYTPLAGESQHKNAVSASQLAPVVMRPEYALLAHEKQDIREVRRFDNAVDEILSLRRVVVLGEPGAGKTTTLWKLARQLVDEAIADPSKPIPLVIRLGKWTGENQSLQDFITQELGELGRYLSVLLAEKRAALLLDGLNEIPVSQRRANREAKDQQVKMLIETHPNLLAAVSCRARDYTMDLGFDRIEIQPLDPIRIQEFCARYLGNKAGEALFWRLAGGEALRVVWTKWEKAGASLKLFFETSDIPRETPNVYSVTNSADDQLWRDHIRNSSSLMMLSSNPYMLSMLAQVFHDRGMLPENRGELFRDFALTLLARERLIEIDPQSKQPLINETAQGLLDGLAGLAYEMQIRRAVSRQGNEGENDALTALPVSSARTYVTEQQLYQAGSTSLLSVSEYVRFTHQLLQEYFAARYMQGEIEAERLTATSIWKAENWWEPTNWEEATILLAGLYSDDCTPIVKWVAEANPEVAARCMVQSGAQTPNETREWLGSMWLPRLTDGTEGPKARAAVGRGLGLSRLDNRRGVGLDKNGLPDIEWVEIPAGTFIYQENQKLNLSTFKIAKYPVTYTQFQAFIEAADGYYNAKWWEGLAAGEQYRSGPGEQAFKYANHPRETVSWYDAVAFCRWLSAKLDYKIRLPTEQEWEKAARGTDRREYPYGNEFDAAKGNTRETGIEQTSAVGIFPDGASPYGVLDMSGNVWQLCLNEHQNLEKPQLEGSEVRVLRGGSWLSLGDYARSAYRDGDSPALRNDGLGFRVVRSASLNS